MGRFEAVRCSPRRVIEVMTRPLHQDPCFQLVARILPWQNVICGPGLYSASPLQPQCDNVGESALCKFVTQVTGAHENQQARG